jgi:SAM-dependent methyltransferase
VKLGRKGGKKGKKKSETDTSSIDLEYAKYKLAKHSERRAIIIMIALFIILIIFLASVISFTSPKKTSQLSAYSDRWNDVSKFREHIASQKDGDNNNLYETSSIISSPTILKDIENISGKKPNDCLYLALGVEKKYNTDEVREIIDFVYDGGSAIIADDFGYGNSFVNSAQDIDESFNIRFARKPLWDENYAVDPRFIKINVNQDESRFFEGIILLNDPTALDRYNPSEKWYGKTLVSSSGKGWVDINGDGKPSIEIPDEKMGKKSIIHEIGIGKGKAVFISDPSIFINDMWNRENNSAFADALVKYVFSESEDFDFENNETKLIIFDESLHMQDNIITNARHSFYQSMVVFTTNSQLEILVGILALLFLGVLLIIIEDPPGLRHRFNINFYNLNELRSTTISTKDCDRIRYIYLERLRITNGLSIEDFKELSYDELYDIIRDDDLVEFALEWDKKYYSEDLQRILLKVRDAF